MIRLSIYLLGTFQISLDGAEVANFSTDKTRALLAYLAAEAHRPHRREALAGLLWPDYPERSARTSLRSALANLRLVIGDRQADPPFLLITRQTLQINPDSDIWVDASVLDRRLGAERIAQTPISELEEAVALHQGSFLQGFSLADTVAFSDWVLLKRERLERLIWTAFGRLTTGYEEVGDYQKAILYARRRVDLDPWQESAQRALMRLLVVNGRRAAALAQYEACRKLLAEELGVEPEQETTRLYERIRDGLLQETRPSSIAPSVVSDHQPSFLTEVTSGEVEKPLFVARNRELTELETRLERALARKGQVAFVVGGAGRGKTTLMEEFARRTHDTFPVVVTTGFCNAYSGVGDPYLPFRQVLELLTGDVEAMWAAGRITKEHATRLWQTLPHTAQAVVELGPDLINTFLPGNPLVERATSAVDDGGDWLPRLRQLVAIRNVDQSPTGIEQQSLYEQYARVLEQVAQQMPLLLILDDLQWADQGSVGLLFHLGRRLSGSRVMLIGAYRPDEVAQGRNGDRHPLEGVLNELQRVHGNILLDLAYEDTDADLYFVNELVDSEPNRLGPAFRQKLYNRTQGHPLFTIELLRMLQERGDLIRDGKGNWAEGPALSWEELPARVESVISQRIDRLDDTMREILAIASVEGEEFTAQVVAIVQDIPERKLLGWLSRELEKRHRLVRERSELQAEQQHLSIYRFTHNLYQRYLYEDISAGERRLLHGEVASALERLYAENPEVVTAQLAYHYNQAAQSDKALHYLTQAGKQAQARYAGREAERYYSMALSLLPESDLDRFDLLMLRSAVYDMMALREAQRADIDVMLALAVGLDDGRKQNDALLVLADYYLTTEPFKAREPLFQARKIAQSLADPIREAQTLRRLAWAGRLGADFQTSLVFIEEAVTRFTEAGLPGEAAGCLFMLARRLPGSGEHYFELDAAERALAFSLEAGDYRLEAVARKNLAIAYMNEERYSEALHLAEAALSMQQDLGDRNEECNTLDIQGVILARLGRMEEAMAKLRQCLTLADEIGSDWGVLGATFGFWNYWYVPCGEYEQLLVFIDERLSKALTAGRDWLYGFLSWIKTLTLAELGQFSDALTLTETAQYQITKGDLVSKVFVLVDAGWVKARLGHYQDARQDLEAALEVAERAADPYLVSWPLVYLAKLTLMENERAGLLIGLGRAQKVAATSRDVHEVRQLAEALDTSALLYLALGESEKAFDDSSEVMRLLIIYPSLPRPQNYFCTHAVVLRALGREDEADEYLRRAHERVMFVAGKFTDESLRRSWLENVSSNRDILRDWTDGVV